MRSLAQKQTRRPEAISSSQFRLNRLMANRVRPEFSSVGAQRLLCDAGTLKAQENATKNDARTAEIAPCSGFDFSRVTQYPVLTATANTETLISQRGDEGEKEADRIAETVVRMPDNEAVRAGEARIAPIPSSSKHSSKSRTPSSPLQLQLDHLKGAAHSLPGSLKSYFESRLHWNFGNVRLYSDSNAAELAASVNARAFATGENVVFGAGQYAPETFEGKKLIAHELTHVMQHGSDRSAIHRKISFESPVYSHEDFVEKIVHKKDPALTTPTLNGTMLADTKKANNAEEAKQLYSKAGQIIVDAFAPKQFQHSGKTRECTFKDFDLKVGAHVMLPNEPKDKKWEGSFPGKDFPGCKSKAQVPVIVTGNPDSTSIYQLVGKQEQEHVDALKSLYDKRLEPHFKWVMSLKETGDDDKCEKSLMNDLGNKDTLMASDFIKDWSSSINKLDKGGGHTLHPAIHVQADCSAVDISVKK